MALERGIPFGIGSLPHVDVERALDAILGAMPGSPHWPQLPGMSFLEGMEHQFSACLPGLVVDRDRRRASIDTSSAGFPGDLERFWENALAVGQGRVPDFFALPEDRAHGFRAFLDRAGKAGGLGVAKGQVTGPFTLGLGLSTTDGRPILHDETLGEVVTSAVACQGRWQARALSGLAGTVVMGVDEPVLASFGSTAMITVTREQVVRTLGEVIAAIHEEGAIAWTHCCGNTDWSMIVDAGVDVVSFDAYRFADRMEVYAPSLSALLERGGWIAWGIVPTSGAIRGESARTILARLGEAQAALALEGVDPAVMAERTLISPSCGTGPMSVEDAEAVYAMTADVARALREEGRIGWPG